MEQNKANAQEQVDHQLEDMSQEDINDILKNFNHFKSYLSEQVTKGERIGLSEEMLAKATEKVANYLAKHEDPKNREEYLLRELWLSGNKDQQHHLAHMLLNMVKED